MPRRDHFDGGYVGARGERPDMRFERLDMSGFIPAALRGGTSYSLQAVPRAKVKGKSQPLMGQVLYDEHPGEKQIKVGKIYVQEEHRRRGIASALADTLQRAHPEHSIDWGGFEPMGEKWRKGYNKKTGKNIKGYKI